MKKVFAFIVVVSGILVCYYQFLMPTPQRVVKKYINATMTSDYEALVACFDPATQKAMQGIGGIASSLIGVEFSDIMALAPVVQEEVEYQIDNIRVVDYVGIENSNSNMNSSFWRDLQGTLFAEEAEVIFTISSDETGNVSTCQVTVKKYGMEWLIPGDEDLTYL